MKGIISSIALMATTVIAATSSSYSLTIESTSISTVPCSSSSATYLAPSSFVYSNSTTSITDAAVASTYPVIDVSSSADPADPPTDPTSSADPADPPTDPTSSIDPPIDPPATTSADPSSSSSSSKVRSTLYAYVTDTENGVFEVTTTVCTNGNCYVSTLLESSTTLTTTVDGILTVLTTAIPVSGSVPPAISPVISTEYSSADPTESEALTTYTTTVDGVVTVVTTYCPFSGKTTSTEATVAPASTTSAPIITTSEENETSTETLVSTTVITITSCKENKCSVVPKTTGVTVVTEDHTIYTTYCPLSGEVVSSTPAVAPTSEEDTTTTIQITETPAASEYSTINVITNNIVTETPVSTSSQITSAVNQTTISTFSTYEGGAIGSTAKTSGFLGLIISFVFLLI
ncbi:hypothetical protein DFJ63DRAFT_311551 [Scheffersomyces coipomensis]|uniref:uncharacterized protein n=1 Tax=Scheffersomyces coipomensis TaxID=1788519 RepID=UPI00315DCE45